MVFFSGKYRRRAQLGMGLFARRPLACVARCCRGHAFFRSPHAVSALHVRRPLVSTCSSSALWTNDRLHRRPHLRTAHRPQVMDPRYRKGQRQSSAMITTKSFGVSAPLPIERMLHLLDVGNWDLARLRQVFQARSGIMSSLQVLHHHGVVRLAAE